MNAVYRCPKCGTEQPSNALEGLCHRCVVTLSLGLIGDKSVSGSQGSPFQQLGDYELLDEIARGGRGVGYLARQVRLNRLVAVQMIRAGFLAGDWAPKRLQAEA